MTEWSPEAKAAVRDQRQRKAAAHNQQLSEKLQKAAPPRKVASTATRTKAQQNLFEARPRVISVIAVENELPFGGCLVCGANLTEGILKHRGGCLYNEYRRADDLAFKMHLRVEQLENAMANIRDAVREGMRRR